MGADDETDERAIYRTVRELSTQLGEIRGHVAEDTAQLLANYRRDVHVTLLAIQKHLIEIDTRIAQVDDARDRGQRQARLFRWITLGAVVVWIVVNLVVLAYLFGRQSAGVLGVG